MTASNHVCDHVDYANECMNECVDQCIDECVDEAIPYNTRTSKPGNRATSGVEKVLESIEAEKRSMSTATYMKLVAVCKNADEGVSVVKTAESMMDTIFDIKDKLSDATFLKMTDMCRDIFICEPMITTGRSSLLQEGEGRTMCRPTLTCLGVIMDVYKLGRELEVKMLAIRVTLKEGVETLTEVQKADLERQVAKLRTYYTGLILRGKEAFETIFHGSNPSAKTFKEVIRNGQVSLGYVLSRNITYAMRKKSRKMHVDSDSQ